MSLLDLLKSYSDGNHYPMHMPGHKRNVNLLPDYKIDITEINGFDNLHNPEGILKECMEHAASVYDSLDTFYVVNGSTCALQSAIYASAKRGDKVLIGRNCHKSVYNMITVRGLMPVYVYSESGFTLPEDVADVLESNPDIKVAVITSPTYDGIVSDVEKIAEICHLHNVTLIVDEAHGAHLPFVRGTSAEGYFPESAINQGADLVVHSLHKTLPAMTQTAVLHRMSERVSGEKIRHALSIFESSSPSYVLMASIDECINYTDENRIHLFSDYVERLVKFYKHASDEFPAFFSEEILQFAFSDKGCKNRVSGSFDPGKILICGKNLSMTGGEIYDILLNNYGIVPEMSAGDYCLCMTSVCDTDDGMNRLAYALKEIYQSRHDLAKPCTESEFFEKKDVILKSGTAGAEDEFRCKSVYPPKGGKMFCSPGESENHGKVLLEVEYLTLNQGVPEKDNPAEERLTKVVLSEDEKLPVCGEIVAVYPPGAPVLVPGEYVTKECIEYIKKALAAGNEVHGVHDGCIYVLTEE